MKKQGKRQEDPVCWRDDLSDLLKGSAIAGITVLVLLIVCAVLISVEIIKQRWMEGAVLSVCVIGAMVGACYAANRIGKYTLLIGIMVATILFLLLLVAGYLAYGTGSIEQNGSSILFSCLCGGGIAGILTSRPRKKRKR